MKLQKNMEKNKIKKCINCGAQASEEHHVIPLALGGNDIDSNKVWLCSSCHALLHNMNLKKRGEDWKNLQKIGIEKAKKEGKYKGRKKIVYNNEEFLNMVEEWKQNKRTAKSIYEYFGFSSQTFYRRIHELEIK